MKFLSGGDSHRCSQSPSMRREWIEIVGLQSLFFRHGSPSMRREWIEMKKSRRQLAKTQVSLHAEGVD